MLRAVEREKIGALSDSVGVGVVMTVDLTVNINSPTQINIGGDRVI